MARGKYLSLEEARKAGQLDQFAKEHQSEGDEGKLDALLDVMSKPVKTPKEGEKT
jgi:hypothetical protein